MAYLPPKFGGVSLHVRRGRTSVLYIHRDVLPSLGLIPFTRVLVKADGGCIYLTPSKTEDGNLVTMEDGCGRYMICVQAAWNDLNIKVKTGTYGVRAFRRKDTVRIQFDMKKEGYPPG